MRRRGPLVTAHAGCLGSAPNGAENIRLAARSGAGAIELDIRLTSDGRVALSHDPETLLADGSVRALRDIDWAREGPARRPGAPGGPVLLLDEALDLLESLLPAGAPPFALNLDAKEPEAAVAAAGLARRRGWAESVLFSGLEPRDAALVRGELAGFARLLNADPILPASGYGPESLREAAAVALECGCRGLNLDFRAATEELMRYAAPRCLPVFLWTADEPDEMRRVLGLEPYSITTNRPDRLFELLARG